MVKENLLNGDIEKVASFSKALSHPIRVYIMKKLSDLNACCYSNNLAEEQQESRSGLSQHLKELKEAGLINDYVKTPYIKYCVNHENWEMSKQLFSSFFQ